MLPMREGNMIRYLADITFICDVLFLMLSGELMDYVTLFLYFFIHLNHLILKKQSVRWVAETFGLWDHTDLFKSCFSYTVTFFFKLLNHRSISSSLKWEYNDACFIGLFSGLNESVHLQCRAYCLTCNSRHSWYMFMHKMQIIPYNCV